MKYIIVHGRKWSPVILRLCLWMFIAMTKSVLDQLKAVTDAEITLWHWRAWTIFFASIIMEGLLVWRLYLDQSLTQHKEQLNGHQTNPPSLPAKS